MECELLDIIELGAKPASGNLILGKIILFHIDMQFITDNNILNLQKLDQIGRAGGPWYTEIKKSLFKIAKPKGTGIGFDQLPDFLLKSKLTGSQLSKLASIDKIPQYQSIAMNFKSETNLINVIALHINKNEIDKAWKLILNWNENE